MVGGGDEHRREGPWSLTKEGRGRMESEKEHEKVQLGQILWNQPVSTGPLLDGGGVGEKWGWSNGAF